MLNNYGQFFSHTVWRNHWPFSSPTLLSTCSPSCLLSFLYITFSLSIQNLTGIRRFYFYSLQSAQFTQNHCDELEVEAAAEDHIRIPISHCPKETDCHIHILIALEGCNNGLPVLQNIGQPTSLCSRNHLLCYILYDISNERL